MKTHRLIELVRSRGILRACAVGVLLTSISADASVTAVELDALRKQGRGVKLIDVRLPHRFKHGTIPGAMNIPAAVLLEKKLPPLGQVVLFGDGLGGIDVAALADGLNKRQGFAADVLEGGYAAWREFSSESTEAGGLRQEDVQMVTYQKLARIKDSVLMVDLRRKKTARPAPPEVPAPRGGKGAPPAAAQAVDTLAEYCQAGNRDYCEGLAALRKNYGRRKSTDPKAATVRSGPAVTPLIVLVDDDHKTAYAEYRRLKAEGYRRVVILAGGELALQIKGQPGLGRISGAITIPETSDTQQDHEK